MKHLTLFAFFILISTSVFSQKKNGIESDSSINKFDLKGNKVGFWKERKEAFDFEGYYVNGIKEGMWTGYFNDGLVQSIENYRNGLLDGPYLQMKQGATFKIQCKYKNGKLHGVYKEFNGTKADKEINYLNGLQNGLKKVFYPNGKLMEEGIYKNNLRDGYARWYSENGNMFLESYYSNGVLEGKQTSFDKDGKLVSETSYKNNYMEGLYLEYFEDGITIKIKGYYSKDLKNGSWEELDKDGKVLKTTHYKNDIEQK
jgi:antitoxin component YwqK of YwqJK toxin-antitoxin module